MHNIRANPNVRLRIRSGTFDGIAREIIDADEHELARAALCETVYLGDYGECALHLRGLPNTERKSKSCTATGSRPEFRL